MLFWAYKFSQFSVSSSRVLMNLVAGSTDSSFKDNFLCITKLFYSNFYLLLFWAYKFRHSSESSSRVLMNLVAGSSDSPFKDENFDLSQIYFSQIMICFSYELANFLNYPIIIKGLDEIGCWFIWFVFQRRKFWCITKLLRPNFDLLLLWACKFLRFSISSSRVLMRLVIGSSDASFRDKNFKLWPSSLGWRIWFLDKILTFGAAPASATSVKTILRVFDQTTRTHEGAEVWSLQTNASA